MILAISFLLLWQGSFAQPQLDGRYGVDRVAMEKQAKEAAQNGETGTSGTQTRYPQLVIPVITGAKPTPSPQITAVKAVKTPTSNLASSMRDGWGDTMPSKQVKPYTCADKSAILLHSEDGSEHWCLKIEEAK